MIVHIITISVIIIMPTLIYLYPWLVWGALMISCVVGLVGIVSFVLYRNLYFTISDIVKGISRRMGNRYL